MRAVETVPSLDISEIDTHILPSPTHPNRAGALRVGWQARHVLTLCLVDLWVGLSAATAALFLRFGPDSREPYLRGYLVLTLTLPLAWLVALALNRAYEPRHLFVGTDEYARVFRAGVGLTAALAIVSFTFDLRLARGYIIIALPVATAAGITMRYLARRQLHRSWAQGKRLHRVILVGHEHQVVDMTRRLQRERRHGLDVIGACLPAGHEQRNHHPDLPTVFGTFDRVAEAVNRADADTVVVLACPEIDGVGLRRLAWQLERDSIDLVVASTLVDVAGDRATIRPIDGVPLLHIEHPRLKGGRRFIKGVFDRAGASLLLLIAAPVMLLIAGMVRFSPSSRGPVIFRQQRVGKDGRPFVLYKFRTMYVDAEARLAELHDRNETASGLFKMRQDPRVTGIGRWLRRLSLDELPQLLNVVRGEMSLVGPRPPLPSEVAKYPSDMRRRLVVKPGLTGLWQVSGRSDLSWEDTIRLDLTYVENWSLAMDLAILARTLSAVIRSSGAY